MSFARGKPFAYLYPNVYRVFDNHKEILKKLINLSPWGYGTEDLLGVFENNGVSYSLLPAVLHRFLHYPVIKLFPEKQTQTLNLTPTLKPRIWQQRGIEIILSKGLNRGIIKMPTGAGKTIFSLLLSNALKTKTIVIVDRVKILEQWKNSIYNTFSNPTVSILDSSKFDEIVLRNSDFLLTTVQLLLNLIKKDFSYAVNIFRQSEYNMIVYDEAHTTGAAEMYGKSIVLFPEFKYVFGLTATPFIHRHPLHFHTIGDVIIDANKVGYKNDYAKNIKVDFCITDLKPKLRTWPNMTKQQLYSSYQTSIEANSEFLDVAIKRIKSFLSQNRKVLVVVSRLKTVSVLSRTFPQAKILTSKKRDEVSTTDNLVIATYGVAQKGIDFPHIDTLVSTVLIYGKVSVPQLVGRILRNFVDKQDPIALFVYDKIAEKLWGNVKTAIEININKNFRI